MTRDSNQGFFCANCTKLFMKLPPTPQASPAPGFRRSVPEPQSKAKLLKERKAAWKKQRERRKLAGIQADGVTIRGRWTASRGCDSSCSTSRHWLYRRNKAPEWLGFHWLRIWRFTRSRQCGYSQHPSNRFRLVPVLSRPVQLYAKSTRPQSPSVQPDCGNRFELDQASYWHGQTVKNNLIFGEFSADFILLLVLTNPLPSLGSDWWRKRTSLSSSHSTQQKRCLAPIRVWYPQVISPWF